MNAEIIRDLDKILPVVDRVHGEHHPELHEVVKLYAAVKEAPSAELFARLREITSGFSAPEDACPTYRRAYADLETLEKEQK